MTAPHVPAAPPPAGFPVGRLSTPLAPLRRFMEVEASGGIVLLICTVAALYLANSPWAAQFAAFWKTKISLKIGDFTLAGDLVHLVVNDGLMAIFFFVVGLEIKRELVVGELRDPRNALLPLIAAAGGMIVPALVYLALQWDGPGRRGWAIPMSTDIAFVVGFLALFGRRVPFSLKILLLSLAVVDDLGAILVIALVFTEKLQLAWLGVAGAGFLLTLFMNFGGVRRVGAYVLVGVVVWFAFLEAGIHPTVAGVLLGFLTPTAAWVKGEALTRIVAELNERLRTTDPHDARRRTEIERLEFAAREALSPLHRLEAALHPWVAFVIMPLFALANAGVALEFSGLSEPVALAVAAGLLIGKPLGIVLACWLAVKAGIARLPAGVDWPLLTGGACLAGIGFTMALFLNALSFPAAQFPALEAAGKIGTLVGSLGSFVLGAILLLWATRRHGASEASETAPPAK